jgi:peptide/nickel transport system substrate-binding protein
MDEQSYWARRHMALSRRRLLTGGAVAGVALGLTACGGKSGSSSAGGAAGGGGETPVSGGTIIAIQSRDISSLDPLGSQVYTTPERIGLVYPRLLSYDRGPSDDYSATKQVPTYITSGWEFAGDGTTLTFHLKQGVNYSKTPPVNGRELVADDVKFSINRYMTDPISTFAGRYADIDSIQTPDKYTVVFKLKAPSAYVMYALAAEPSFVTPPEVMQKSGDYKQVCIGAGPFLHVSTTQGEGSTFKKNPDFVDAAHIYYDTYQFKVITDLATREAAIRTAQADYQTTGGTALQKPDWQSVTSGNNAVASYQGRVLANSAIYFNVKNPKWKDLRARQAVSKAFDRKGYMKQFFKGDGTFNGPVPPGFGAWALSDQQLQAEPTYQYDPQAAKQLWQAAGSPATSIEYYIAPKEFSATAADQAQFIAANMKAAFGVDATFTTDEYNTYLNKGYNNKFPDTNISGQILYDPLDYLLTQYIPGGTRNHSGTDDPQLTQMLNEIRGTIDSNTRQQKMIAAQHYINQQNLSGAYIPAEVTYDVYNAKLRHFLPGVRPPGSEWTLSSWKVK